MSDIVTRLRTVKVPESRHVGFTYETWAGEAADEIERLRDALAGMTGLVQLIAARDDLPTEIKDAMLQNHRFHTATQLLSR